MKLLFDQNLSRHLVKQLAADFADSCHVTAVGLDASSDAEIWAYTAEHGYTIVSKDSDFRQLAFLNGPPPKVVWLRMGNASTRDILHVLRDHRDTIESFANTEDEALLVIPSA